MGELRPWSILKDSKSSVVPEAAEAQGAAGRNSHRTLRVWYHQQESNLYLALRRRSFYPLNYGGDGVGL
jgi:hypothetical protein